MVYNNFQKNVWKEMLSIIKYSLLLHCVLIGSFLYGQVTTEQEVIQLALNHPTLQMAKLDIQQNKARQRNAFNPSQPRFEIEFPTDFGLGFEAEQEFDFPTTYTTRSKWLKSQTRLAEEAAYISGREVTRDVRMIYLEAQLVEAQIRRLRVQDSLWQEIATKSKRLFDGGEINKADLLYAENQASFTKFSLDNATVEATTSLARLSNYAGQKIERIEKLTPLSQTNLDSTNVFYFENYLAQSKQVAENEINVFKAERLPDLIIGYLKVDDLDTEFRYRYKAGVTVPLWQGQYGGEIEASKVEIEKIQLQRELKVKEANLSQLTWVAKLSQTKRALEWFETSALPRMEELVSVYLRLFEAGEIDYAITLRNIADVLNTQNVYLETIKQHNESVIQLSFLTGKN